MYPAKVADAVVDFEQLIQEARKDVERIAFASEETAENTSATAENTAKLANAISNWVNFESPPDIQLTNHDHLLNSVIENHSPFPVQLNAQIQVAGDILETTAGVVPPKEYLNVSAWLPGDTVEVIFCLSGTSAAFGQDTFYERRVYQKRHLIEATQGFERPAGC